MAEIKLRDLQLTYDGETLTISSLDRPEKFVSLDPKTVEELVEFVQLLSPPNHPQANDRSIGENRRESFRVPVTREFGLKVELVVGKKRFNTLPINVSMTGVFVEQPSGKSVDLKINDEVSVRLSMQEIDVELAGIVRRADRKGIGLFFPVSIKNEHVDPPPAVRRIVMELQRRWMMMRKD